MKRLFIKGLPPEITREDLKKRFESFGAISNICFSAKGFCFFDLESNEYLKLIKLYNNTKWKQARLRVELAKLDFLVKLQQEREFKPVKRLKYRKVSTRTKFKVRLPSTGRQVLIDPKKYSKHTRF